MEEFTAVWTPAWYALDQKIARGLASKFIFGNDNGQKGFFSGTGNGEGFEAVYAKIDRIHNNTIGEIEEIDTYGLSYRIWLPGDEMIQVEAEERPGIIEGATPTHLQSLIDTELTDLTFTVELEKLYPSDINALEMLPVVINDEVSDYFKWADHDYDEIKELYVFVGGMVHYLLQLMKSGGNEMKIRQAMMFIDKIYTDNNPLITSLVDENILHPLALKNEADQFIEKLFSQPTRDRIYTHRKRIEIINKMWQ